MNQLARRTIIVSGSANCTTVHALYEDASRHPRLRVVCVICVICG